MGGHKRERRRYHLGPSCPDGCACVLVHVRASERKREMFCILS